MDRESPSNPLDVAESSHHVLGEAVAAWVAERWPELASHAHSLADETLRRCLLKYAERGDDARSLAFTMARRVVTDFLRGETGQRLVAAPPGASSVHFEDFIFRLGRQEALEVVRWHRGVTDVESARERRVQVESVKRMRRRISVKWKEYLAESSRDADSAELTFRDSLDGMAGS